MGKSLYEDALKSGKKEYRTRVAQGQSPYLPVLDEILKRVEIAGEEKVGLVKVPLNLVVGTCTEGRTFSFAANFMPVMETKTEFAFKWSNLAKAQEEEGIRDPIVAYEFMNRYYVLEGNKRVSVLKFFGANDIYANVTRKLPKKIDNPDVRRYYELIRFMKITGINTLEFSKEGHAMGLLKMIGKETEWTAADREEFTRVSFGFEQAYNHRGGDRLPLPFGEALYAFMSVFTWPKMQAMTVKEFNDNVIRSWGEFLMLTQHHAVDIVMDPKEEKSKRVLSYLIPGTHRIYNVAFLYPKSPEDSQWIYSHELGRMYLEQTFPSEVHTFVREGVNPENTEAIINEVIGKGADIIFGVGPQLAAASVKAAAENPEVKILNCSLNTAHKLISTYYARMYEAKFISGMVAGAMANNDRIAYIADYPIFGMIANINAFALGAQMTNPRVKVYLDWSTRKGFDLQEFIHESEAYIISDQDMVKPSDPHHQFGLYKYDADGNPRKLILPLWDWGEFYARIIRSIMSGTYQSEKEESSAINYWWGMSAGVVDLIVSGSVPEALQRLAKLMQQDIVDGRFKPFSGELYAQDGTKVHTGQDSMNPRQIMKMDYLLENVIGTIPSMESYTEPAKTVIAAKGIEEKQ